MALERLQKLLARAGVASRRVCEELIAGGRVMVDGHVVTTLGVKADLGAQDVRLDGRRLRPERLEYWILNKPKGVVCTNYDPAGRPRPIDLVRATKVRLFPVGRLDAASKGLLLMTNDGEFANRLTHPRYGVPKTYLATVGGHVTAADIRRMVRGVHLAEGRTRAAEVHVVKRGRFRSRLRITLREGRNRQIRRVLARLGHPVRELVRTRIGRIALRGLRAGEARRLTDKEIQYLKTLRGQDETKPRPPTRKTRATTARTKAAANNTLRKEPRDGGRKQTKRSQRKDDTNGTGKAGKGHRRHAAGSRGGPARRRTTSPRRGRRPRDHSAQ